MCTLKNSLHEGGGWEVGGGECVMIVRIVRIVDCECVRVVTMR